MNKPTNKSKSNKILTQNSYEGLLKLAREIDLPGKEKLRILTSVSSTILNEIKAEHTSKQTLCNELYRDMLYNLDNLARFKNGTPHLPVYKDY